MDRLSKLIDCLLPRWACHTAFSEAAGAGAGVAGWDAKGVGGAFVAVMSGGQAADELLGFAAGAGAGAFSIANLDIDGGTDIGEAIVDADLFVIDNGAGGTNRKAALSRVVTLMTAQGFITDDPTALAIALG